MYETALNSKTNIESNDPMLIDFIPAVYKY